MNRAMSTVVNMNTGITMSTAMNMSTGINMNTTTATFMSMDIITATTMSMGTITSTATITNMVMDTGMGGISSVTRTIYTACFVHAAITCIIVSGRIWGREGSWQSCLTGKA